VKEISIWNDFVVMRIYDGDPFFFSLGRFNWLESLKCNDFINISVRLLWSSVLEFMPCSSDFVHGFRICSFGKSNEVIDLNFCVVLLLFGSRVCGNPHGLIRKYGLMCCRQCFRSNAKEIGFIKVTVWFME